MAIFKRNSRYTGGTTLRNRNGQNFLILRRPLNLLPSSDDVFISISKELVNRPDLISSKAYRIPDLWWAIYEFNGISDPLFGLQAGRVLRIPSYDSVVAAIKKLGT